MADNLIEIIIRAKDEASAAFKKCDESLKGLADAGKAAIIPMSAVAAAGTALIAKATLTAARTEELGVVIENLGRVSGYSQEQLDETEESIKELGITTQGARTIMSRFMGAELDLADATKIARAAQDLAVIGMEDSSTAAENLTYAIASMQPRVLRQYGIFVNLNDVYEQQAELLGKTAEELTENEKRQGMLNAVVEQAGNFTGTYEAAMTTAGKQLRSMSRYTEEAANAFGESFLPYLSEGVNLVTELTKGYLALDPAEKESISRTVAYATAMSGATAAASAFLILLPKIKTAMLALYGPGGAALLGVAVLAALAVRGVEVRMEQERLRRELLESAKSAEEYVAGMKEIRDLQTETTPMTKGLAGEVGRLMEERNAEADAIAYQVAKMKEWEGAATREEYLGDKLAQIQHDIASATMEAADAMSYEMGMALASNVLGLKENIDRYQELEDTVITAHVDMTARVADYNRDVERLGIDRATALKKLEEGQAADIQRILAGGHARTHEQNEEALAWQRGVHDKELADFNALWDDKEKRRTDDYELANSQAWAAAEERRKAEEAARLAEMEALKEAQKERLLLFALEMVEYKGKLQIPIEGWEDMEVSAQDYFDLVKAGIIPATDDISLGMGDALLDLKELWEDAGESGQDSMEDWDDLLEDVIPNVMDLGDEIGNAETDTKALEKTTVAAARHMGREIEDNTEKMDEYAQSIRRAMQAYNKLQEEPFGGVPPGLQSGLSYVPSTMPAVLHRGEAVLTREQAEVWRSQMNVNVGNVYGMDAFGDLLDQHWFRMGQYAT